MMKKVDKTQGMVFVLPKSREFFGRISKDFQKTGLMTQRTEILPTDIGDSECEAEIHAPRVGDPRVADAEQEISNLEQLKDHLSKLSKLHKRLQGLLNELDLLVKEEN